MTAKQRSNRQRRVLCVRAIITLVVLTIFGSSQQTHAQQWNTNGNDISNANSGNVGVGTTTPVSALHVATETTAVPRGITNSQHTSDNNSALLTFRKSRGTKLSPAATLNGDNIGNFFAEAYDGSSWVSGGRFRFAIDGTVAAGSVPTSIQFFTGSSAQGTERMRITSAGDIGIGTSAPEVRLSIHHSSANTNIGATQLADLSLGLRNTSATNGNMSLISFQDSTGFGNAHVGAIQTNHTNHSADLVFLTRNSGTLAERLRVKSDGNVGIGTSSPFYKLHAASGTDTFTNLLFLDTAVHGGTLFGVGGNTNNESAFALHVYRAGQYFNRLYVDNFGRLSLSPNGDGHVGVGTAAPSYRLDVQGGQINSSGGLCIAGDCKTAWSQVGGGTSQWTTNGSNIYFNTGNVGLGTTTPGVALDVSQNKAIRVGHANLSSGGDYVHLANHAWYNGTAWQLDGTAGGLYQISGQQHAWYAHNGAGSFTNIMQLGGNGNLGIGTTTPNAKLHVAGQIRATDSSGNGLRISDDGSGSLFMALTSSDSARNLTLKSQNMLFHTGVTYAEKMRIDQNGNVGIGTTSPGSKLFVGSGTPAVATLAGLNVALGGASYVSASNGTENIFMGADGSGYGIVGTLSNHSVGIRTNNTERVRIDTSGNVGIGTASPIAKLHVAGDGKVTGNLTVDGNIAAKYQDVAEWVPAVEALAPGTVVTLNRSQSNLVEASSKSYDTRVAGVVSEKPGLALGEPGQSKLLIATTGRVRIKVDATSAPIEIGDLLVTSEKEGIAMKSVPVTFGGVEMHRPGTLIGKALEPLAKGQGEILVLLSLQ